jgi:hypothetical protein
MKHSGDFTCSILKLVLITQKTFNRVADNAGRINKQNFLSHLLVFDMCLMFNRSTTSRF